jgi:TRAP-type C4-dicarboxylate transport system substrate-binding protein
MRALVAALLLLLLLLGATARADHIVWRMATSAPDGTAWARELRAFARDVQAGTDGEVLVKWYFGGIAGDENEMMDRIAKAQLDGMGAGMLCTRVAPAMRAFNIPGVIQGRDEANYLSQKMMPEYAAEAQKNGFAMLFSSGLGPTMFYTRTPISTMDGLRSIKLWRWNLDEAGLLASREMGMPVWAAPVEQAARAYDDGTVDGFTAPPAAALAFQWSTQARYITDLRVGYVQGCMLLANRVWDRLTQRQREAVMAAAAKCAHRFDQVGRQMDADLLGGLFEKQGLKMVPTSTALRAQYFEAARAARERLGERLISRAMMDQVMRILADYRAEHPE